MHYCTKCGNPLDEGVSSCPHCGAGIGVESSSGSTEHTAEFSYEDISDNKYLAAICYLSLVFLLVAVLVKPDSRFVRFHANQALLAELCGVAIGIAAAIPLVGIIVAVLSPVAAIVLLVFRIMGAVWALQSRAKELPIFGKIQIIK